MRIMALDERETGPSPDPSILLDSCFALVRAHQQQIIDVPEPHSNSFFHPDDRGELV